MAQALKLIPASAVRANDVDAERIDPDLLGIGRKFKVALDAEPIHDDLRKVERTENER